MPEPTGSFAAPQPCPMCGLPSLTSKAPPPKCSPLGDCPAWQITATFDKATRTWLPVDLDAYALDGRQVRP
jgi:hypothetical protein